jgi:ABC-type multidrug transport system permease subunit
MFDVMALYVGFLRIFRVPTWQVVKGTTITIPFFQASHNSMLLVYLVYILVMNLQKVFRFPGFVSQLVALSPLTVVLERIDNIERQQRTLTFRI